MVCVCVCNNDAKRKKREFCIVDTYSHTVDAFAGEIRFFKWNLKIYIIWRRRCSRIVCHVAAGQCQFVAHCSNAIGHARFSFVLWFAQIITSHSDWRNETQHYIYCDADASYNDLWLRRFRPKTWVYGGLYAPASASTTTAAAVARNKKFQNLAHSLADIRIGCSINKQRKIIARWTPANWSCSGKLRNKVAVMLFNISNENILSRAEYVV